MRNKLNWVYIPDEPMSIEARLFVFVCYLLAIGQLLNDFGVIENAVLFG